MIRRIPIIPTVLVLLAIGVMIRLGVWQLDRMHQKDDLLARYAAAGTMPAEVPFPHSEAAAEPVLYRHARIDCRRVTDMTSIAGHNARGTAGLAQVAQCVLPDGASARVVLGWSQAPGSPDWKGGEVVGTVAPGPRLVADPPLAGLEPNAKPDPADIPNNHLSYAVQWFLFAVVALVIYGLAVRKRVVGK